MIEEYDALRGYNFVFNPWPAAQPSWSQPKTYSGVLINLGAMQNHKYAPYLAGKSTRWTALQLVRPYDTPTTVGPFDLDEGMFAAPIRFGKAGLLDHATEVVYSNEFKVHLQLYLS